MKEKPLHLDKVLDQDNGALTTKHLLRTEMKSIFILRNFHLERIKKEPHSENFIFSKNEIHFLN